MKKLRFKGFRKIVCSFGLIVFIIGSCAGQVLDSARTDRISGVWLTSDGFKKVLFQRDDLLQCEELMASKMKQMKLLEFRIKIKDSQITSFQNIRDTQAKDIKKLKRLVWKKNFQVYGLGGIVAFLSYRLIFR